MSISPTSLPAITLDLKKQRIRIHSNTLQLLNNPAYIDLLVNPDRRILAVRASKKGYPFSHKIIYSPQQDHELYSKVLLKQLRLLHPGMKSNSTYRLCGRFLPDKDLVLFEMSGMCSVGGPAGEEA